MGGYVADGKWQVWMSWGGFSGSLGSFDTLEQARRHQQDCLECWLLGIPKTWIYPPQSSGSFPPPSVVE